MLRHTRVPLLLHRDVMLRYGRVGWVGVGWGPCLSKGSTLLSNRSWLCEPFQRTICKMDQKRTIKAEHHYWHDRSMLARHEETRTNALKTSSPWLLVYARSWQWRYINMSKNLLKVTAAAVRKALSWKCTKIDWQAWGNRPRDAIAAYVFQDKNWRK